MASSRVPRGSRARAAGERARGCAIPPPRGRKVPAPHRRRRSRSPSRCEAEVDDVAVLDDVLLALEADLAPIAAGGHRSAIDEGAVGDDFRANEAAGDVAVNLASRELRAGAARNRPGAVLVFADREERDVAEQIVAGADDPIQARFG